MLLVAMFLQLMLVLSRMMFPRLLLRILSHLIRTMIPVCLMSVLHNCWRTARQKQPSKRLMKLFIARASGPAP